MRKIDCFDFEKHRQPRKDTKLESEAAEFLVLAELLLFGIPSFKAYTNMGHYDLVATDPKKKTAATIQVKCRMEKRAPGFPIKRFECDFVVFVRLDPGRQTAPEFFVFPTSVDQAVWRPGKVGKVYIKDILERDKYRNAWDVIRKALA